MINRLEYGNLSGMKASRNENSFPGQTGKLPFKEGQVVIPGDEIVKCSMGWMQGMGLHVDEVRGTIVASVMGRLRIVNKLLYVEDFKSKYVPKEGDVIVGRVQKVVHGKWLVDIGGWSYGELPSCNVYINRPKEFTAVSNPLEVSYLRQIFAEDDLICCEIQRLSVTMITTPNRFTQLHMSDDSGSTAEAGTDGGETGADQELSNRSRITSLSMSSSSSSSTVVTAILQVRNGPFGKLQNNGCLIQIKPTLVGGSNQRIINLGNGLQIITGSNGFFFVSAQMPTNISRNQKSMSLTNTIDGKATYDEMPMQIENNVETTYVDIHKRRHISRVRNCILLLSHYFKRMTVDNISLLYHLTEKHNIPIQDILKTDVSSEILEVFIEQTQQ